MYFPFSRGRTTSLIAPAPIETTPLPPVACTALKNNNNQYSSVGHSASPMLAPM